MERADLVKIVSFITNQVHWLTSSFVLLFLMIVSVHSFLFLDFLLSGGFYFGFNFLIFKKELWEETTHFKTMKLSLSFVANHERAFWRLRKRMETLTLDYCCLRQAADPVLSSTTFPLYYYCCSVNNRDLFRERYNSLITGRNTVLCEVRISFVGL